MSPSRRLTLAFAAACTGYATAPTVALAAAAPPPALRVVGGQPASPGAYPWMAAIYNGSPASGPFCGGSLVRATVVVTAAHCLSAVRLGSTAVLLGRTTLSGTGGEQITVAGAAYHPRYNATGRTEHDVAVLVLSRPSAQPTLAVHDPFSGPGATPPGWPAKVLGWGVTAEGGEGSDTLLEATVPIVSDANCAAAYGGSTDPATQICAGYLGTGGVDTCQGDSGGPLLAGRTDDGRPLLAGLTSWGIGCARPEYPGVYTEVFAPAVWAFVAPFLALP